MSEPSLSQLERDVEGARAKLARDLSTLRSPQTTGQFTDALMQEAISVKDAVLDKAKASVKLCAESLLEDIKARAAANPAAALAIGTGIAWRLLRSPPIATALVGAGVLGLFRTPPARLDDASSDDYLSVAKSRLVEQVGEVTEEAKEKAAALGDSIAEKVTETATDLKGRFSELAEQATSSAREAVESSAGSANAMWSDTRDTANAMWNEQSGPLGGMASPISDVEARDKLLLGAAGVAVVTALGIVLQRKGPQRKVG
jgi:hypothetical protein